MSNVEILPQVAAFLDRRHGCFIDGQWVFAEGEHIKVINPATGQTLCETLDAPLHVVEQAVQSSHAAFKSRVWSGLRPADRERILLNFTALVEAHAEELAQLETLSQGKSINLARGLDLNATVEFMRYMSGWATKIEGQTFDVSIPLPPGARFTAFTKREPVGVVVGIVPWNFPLLIAAWKLMPALATGCTVIIKPAMETPLTAMRLAELALEAGIPAGVFNVVTGGGASVGGVLTAHPLVSKVSFTGSTAVGKSVGVACMENMTRFALELGGKNPMIVLADADIDKAIQGAILGGLLNNGQVCAAASRFYVHRSVYDRFVEGLAAAVSAMPLGAGMDGEAAINPLVSRKQQQGVLRHIEQARAEGARVVIGGDEVAGEGFYVRPTILADIDHGMAVAREEVFGPVLGVMAFDDEDAVIELANDNRYGLAASLWTNDLGKAMNLVPRIEAGTVWVNAHVLLDPAMPFGGVKQSGMGREFGRAVIEAYTELKSVCIAH
ncbi:aldehyde dehydrogenase family protein [Pseudomonas sp. D8002]|jgi:phenylacetaldehyde dehydrogenase|uniref:aldehyde dehydrogenase family protein n=3 Tax=Pseudomonas TaxID=286 RepID=UPI000272D0AB|nr:MULTISPECIES: aldehyde dehydrogenase family protein [unclassified Pseudomonas]MDP9062922.1 aldehyde dehydrogenase family protein [Pseudomonadota bacterium]AUO22803.1 NAD-dependent phenylacetaldehyde dehydrogenase [Pseudomonas sp. NC02]EJF73610.1 aldehyde dehydrogenase [Pseudomonas sp. Ag1]MBT1266087.1 aldehyde dehydrogenase family protein [Pseudomonas sp. VS38]MDE1913754.1 aldehyde dehydrogenase family protein [Pseudomonas sp.]